MKIHQPPKGTPEHIACSRCGRSDWGSALPRTKTPAAHPLVLHEVQSRGPVEPDLIPFLNAGWCIDCVPYILAALQQVHAFAFPRGERLR